jgi:hypothetical protein
MMKIPLSLRFKGNRDYGHGTDILDATLESLESHYGTQELTQIDFSFHQMARRVLMVVDAEHPELGKPVAECAYSIREDRHKVFLYETSESITERYPYDEDLICWGFQIHEEDRSGTLMGNPSFSSIEIWVALTKELHQKALPEIKGKWLFVRGRFPSYLKTSEAQERRLRIVSNFQNKLTRTELFADGVKAGEIFFSVI